MTAVLRRVPIDAASDVRTRTLLDYGTSPGNPTAT